MKIKLFTKIDFIIIAAILILSLGGYALVGRNAAAQRKTAVIEVDGREYARYAMDALDRPVQVDVNGHNTVEIARDYACVVSADCPNQLDVRQGKIHTSGQIIVCLPNKMTVRIEGEAKVDAVSY